MVGRTCWWPKAGPLRPSGCGGSRSCTQATPYAVSVFGQSIDAPDPFGRGNGYGDGRAATLGEFSLASGERWELQLKGSGTTPFSRQSG